MVALERRRSMLLVAAILAVCLSFGFSFTGTNIVWFWVEVPWFAAALVAAGAVLAATYLVLQRRSKRRRS